MVPHRSRADANQKEIVDGLRGIGAGVQISSQVGGGFPDLIVGFRGGNFLLEVKDEGYELSKKQVEWHDAWPGQKMVVRNLTDAFRAIGAVS